MERLLILPVALLLTSCAAGVRVESNALPSGPEATIATAVSFTEGPASDAGGNIYFTETIGSRIMKFSPGSRKLEVYREKSNRANGLLIDPQQRLIACEGGSVETGAPQVTRTDLKTGKVEVIASEFEGKRFNAPNDVSIDSKGRLYFTDPVPDSTSPFGTSNAGKVGTPGVYRIDTDGKIERILTAPDTEWPNGVTISPDDRTLYLVEANKVQGGTRAIRAFDLSPEGKVTRMRVHHNFYPGRSADGMCIDQAGNLYAAAGLHRLRGTHETLATKTGVYVFSPEGKLTSFIAIPEDTITNCAFGGADRKTLFITAGKTLFQAQVQIPGVPR